MGNAILSMQTRRAPFPAGPGAWAVAWRSCWTSSRRSTCPSGERQVRRRERDRATLGTLAWASCRGWLSKGPPLHCADETSFEAGIRVQIHSQEEPPYIHQLGFGVSPGFQTFVSCQEQRVITSSWALGWARGWAFGLRGDADQTCPPKLAAHPPVHPWTLLGLWALEGPMVLLGMTPSCPPPQLTYLPQPWGNCRAESGLREPELQGYSAYSVSACRLRCEKEAVLQRCHCRMVHMPGGHPPPC